MLGPYDRSAEVYDLYYGWLDYAEHAAAVHDRIRQKNPGAGSLLELACGTGRYLEQFGEWYEAVGLDVSESMLAIAGERLPEVELHRANMTDFDLGRRFDAVVCLFSSIAYITSGDDLRSVITNAANHLNPGGVLIIEPWFAPDAWMEDHIGARVVEGEGVKVARVDTSVRFGDLVTMRWAWAIARSDGTADGFVEEHPTMLFPVEVYRAAFAAAGLESEYDPEGPLGRGLHVAIKR
jgi:SAM-dependent methyltransferase